MIKLLTLLLTLAITIDSFGCDKNEIYCKIKQLKQSMPDDFAMHLSKAIIKYSKLYKQNPLLSVAIAMQETGLDTENHRKQNFIQYYMKCDKNSSCEEGYRIIEGYTDVCLFQFHVKTIKNYDIDPVKLKNDLDYCVDWHFKLLKMKRNECSDLGEDSWACYHSKTKIHREKYKKLVERYYDK